MTAGRPVALYDVDPDAVATSVLGCAGVVELSGGPFGAAASYLPGRRVAGVRLTPEAVEVHLVMRYGTTVAEVAAQVQQILVGRVGGRRVDVVVEDVATPGGDQTLTLAPSTVALP